MINIKLGLSRLLLGSFVVICACSVCVFAADDNTVVFDEFQYLPSDTVSQDINSALSKAKQSNKLFLLVFGAQWCHDSRGLAAKFSDKTMYSLLQANYEILFVDVGYLEDKRALMQRFSYPGYFGTPTLLVIEPNSERLLNYDSVSKWQSADSVPMDDYLSYFADFPNRLLNELSPAISEYYASQIEAFENRQIERLFHAYSKLGPMLKGYKEDTLDSDEEFNAAWVEVRKFRTQLQQDLISLRHQAQLQDKTNRRQPLVLPKYPEFTHL
ncbi:thioredoxin family protein [Agaribacter flavus]|uniref:Thioredoxin family protein n=1 Tax=Agaribacter flavus TaxID=1902781 RepID=A0ABV7FU33_9ALTE